MQQDGATQAASMQPRHKYPPENLRQLRTSFCLHIKPTSQQHQTWLQATGLPDTKAFGSTKDKYSQNILKPHDNDMNLYTADTLFAQDGENVGPTKSELKCTCSRVGGGGYCSRLQLLLRCQRFLWFLTS